MICMSLNGEFLNAELSCWMNVFIACFVRRGRFMVEIGVKISTIKITYRQSATTYPIHALNRTEELKINEWNWRAQPKFYQSFPVGINICRLQQYTANSWAGPWDTPDHTLFVPCSGYRCCCCCCCCWTFHFLKIHANAQQALIIMCPPNTNKKLHQIAFVHK